MLICDLNLLSQSAYPSFTSLIYLATEVKDHTQHLGKCVTCCRILTMTKGKDLYICFDMGTQYLSSPLERSKRFTQVSPQFSSKPTQLLWEAFSHTGYCAKTIHSHISFIQLSELGVVERTKMVNRTAKAIRTRPGSLG